MLKKIDEAAGEVKFLVLSFDIQADPINTIDRKAEEADDFSFFAEEDGFEDEAKRRELEVKEGFATKGNPFIPGLGQSHQIMNFLDSASEGEISEPIELSGQFVVVHASKVTPKGVRPFEEVKSQIRTAVTNNKRRKMVVQRVEELLASNSGLNALANASDKEVQTVENLSMQSETIQGVGREPEIVGAAFGLEEGAVSDPLKGIRAVYVLKTSNRRDADLSNLSNETRQQIRQRLRSQKGDAFSSVWLDQLKQNAEIEDHRERLLQS